jgi:3-dehydrosphinganine reductase
MDKLSETVMIIIFVVLAHLLILYWVTRKKKIINGKHVCITGKIRVNKFSEKAAPKDFYFLGGSSGIGLHLAINAVKLGANVTVFARNEKKLQEAVEEIRSHKISPRQKVEYKSLDLAKATYKDIESAFGEIEEKCGDIYMLVNCAGMAICGTIEEMEEKDVKYLMDLNYYGTYFPIKYVLPKMKARKDGIIVMTGSQASLLGIYGLGAYSAAKFALRGLAETLAMETKHLGISVTLALPTDTDTPGFENEQKSKPIETKLICGSGGKLSIFIRISDLFIGIIFQDSLHPKKLLVEF